MSSKIEQINAAFKDARLARDTVKVETIKLLLGEIQRLDKKSLDDTKIDSVIYKMVSNIDDTIRYLNDQAKIDQLKSERVVLMAFATPEITVENVVEALGGIPYEKGEAMRIVKSYCAVKNLKFNGNVVNQVLNG